MHKRFQTAKTLAQSELIAISGKQYSGKDVLTHLLLKALPHFKQIPIATEIKNAYAAQHHLTLTDIENNKALHRPGLIALGDWGRKQDPNYWLKQVLIEPGPKIISDVRLKQESALLKAQGAFLIRLNADRAVRAQRGQIVSEHDPTEQELDHVMDWDAILTNNGNLDELETQVKQLLGPVRGFT